MPNEQREIGQTDLWVNVPYDIEPITFPVKTYFSKVCSGDGICGAFGLLGQVSTEEIDMIQLCGPA